MSDLTKTPYNLNSNEIKSIQNIVKNMSLEEKIGQLFFVINSDNEDTNLKKFIQKYKPGGIMFRPEMSNIIKSKINLLQKHSNIPLFVSANLESGGNGIIQDGTWVGNPLQISATNDTQSAYDLGNISGNEAGQVGCNMAFAPIVDIDMNFRNPITNTRTFGNDVSSVKNMGWAQCQGLQENKIVPVIKHFPGDGVDERDQHIVTSINSLDKDKWMETFGSVYRHFIKKGIPSIMIGHIMQPAWERFLKPAIRDEELMPASASELLINGLLREKLGFNGLAITDATPMIGYNVSLSRKLLLPKTINAGIDMILFNKNIDEDYSYIFDAVELGIISTERLNEAVTRILGIKVSQNIIDLSKELIQYIPNKTNFKFKEHKKTVQKIADKSITLVKDRDQLLPISPSKTPKIRLVVLGDKDTGGFKEGGKVTDKFIKGLKLYGFDVHLYNQNSLDFHEVFNEGVSDLKDKFDLAIYIANIETASNQTTTRLDWVHLMAADAPWYLRDIPTIFISMANPYHLFDIPSVSTYINAYTGNNESIEAVLKKITGQEKFVGQSPIDPFCGELVARL